MPKITLQDVEDVRALSPRRCCFAQSRWKVSDNGKCSIGLKFDYLGHLFTTETGVSLSEGRYGPWASLSDEKQIRAAIKWQKDRANFVFMRDNLSSSVALDFNLQEAAVYTKLGQAEHDAKGTKDGTAISFLVDACASAIKSLKLYKDCDSICAVPPSPNKSWDLPTELAKRIAVRTGLSDLSGKVAFSKNKASVKALNLADKWGALDAGKLVIATTMKGAKIILLDDKYQSGTTAQFVASKLYDAGAAEIHGLFCVKTWRDTDNK